MTPVRLNCISALMLMQLKSDLCIFCICCQAKFSNGVTIRAGESKVLQVKAKEGDTENSSVWTNAKINCVYTQSRICTTLQGSGLA